MQSTKARAANVVAASAHDSQVSTGRAKDEAKSKVRVRRISKVRFIFYPEEMGGGLALG
jgi:hypothetical protein